MRQILERIAAEFPLPEADCPAGTKDSGPWTEEMIGELLDAIEAEHSTFRYTWSNQRHGWLVWCPGNDVGWSEGESHSDYYSEVNESTMVLLVDGWASFSCRHNHCKGEIGGAEDPTKKKFRHFLDHYDPDRVLIEYPALTAEDWHRLMHLTYAESAGAFNIEEDVLGLEYRYRLTLTKPGRGKIGTNDGNIWFDEKGQRL